MDAIKQTGPVAPHEATEDSSSPEVQRILSRNDKVFRLFVVGSALTAALILLKLIWS